MVKPFNPLELTARVKSQLRRYTQLGNLNQQGSSQVYKCGGLMINDENKEVTVDGEPIKLTPIEYNILLLLVKNAGKVFSIDQISKKSGMKTQLVQITLLPSTSAISARKSRSTRKNPAT